MPYTKNPTVSTYDTKRMSFVYNPLHRSGTILNKDARLINMLVDVYQSPDQENTRIFVKSRPGLSSAYTTAAGVGRGIYYWYFGGVSYAISVSGNKVYSNGTLLQTITTSTGDVGFTEHVASTGIVKLVLVDGTKGYVFSSPTVAGTEITSGNFPTPHIAQPIFLDGYIFLAKADTQDIYNSDLDDPSLWTAGNYISAEMFPDKIITLSKNNNYIYAVGSSSVEYFYDAAGVTTPLARHDSAVQQFGTAAASSVVASDDEVILVGTTSNGGHTIWTINGFKAKEIATPSIRSILRGEGAAISNSRAYCIRVSGQKLYVLNLTNITLVYSFDSQMWVEWTSGVTGANTFVGRHATDGPNGAAYVLDFSTGNIYTISEDNYTDNGTNFLCQMITPKYDFDTFNRKFMSRFAIIGDWPTTSGTGNIVTLEYSDDDYTTWSTSKNLDFTNDFPVTTQLGTFRRRAFRLSYSQPYQLRLEAFEVDINKGSQ